MYQHRPTQEERILESLKAAGSQGVHPTHFIMDLKIFQYNARIFGLREKFGCTCRNGEKCFAKEHIRNEDLLDGTTKFYYSKTEQSNYKTVDNQFTIL